MLGTTQITAAADRLSAGFLPSRCSVSTVLRKRIDSKSLSLLPNELPMFISGSIEMWQRALHSFLVSVALTDSSHIWASTTAYYASHYVMRSVCHLFGVFALAQRHELLELKPAKGRFQIGVLLKGFREHQSYWTTAAMLITDRPDLFHENDEEAHRSFGNYQDHIDQLRNVTPWNERTMQDRIAALARMPADPILPKDGEIEDVYPNIVGAQALAMHRICFMRERLDVILGSKNKFWNANRAPGWCANIMKYQMEPQRIPTA